MAGDKSQKRKAPVSDADLAVDNKLAKQVKRAYEEGVAAGKREEKTHYKGVLPLYREQWKTRLQLEECRKILAKRQAKLKFLTKIIASERAGKPLALEAMRAHFEKKVKEISEEVDNVKVPEMNWEKLGIDYM